MVAVPPNEIETLIQMFFGPSDFEFQALIPHSPQKLSCLKSGVSYSLTVSLPINHE